MPKWYEQVRMDPGNNYVSSRVRLSRNWADYKFPNRLSTAEAEEMLRRIHDSLDGFSEAAVSRFRSGFSLRSRRYAAWQCGRGVS